MAAKRALFGNNDVRKLVAKLQQEMRQRRQSDQKSIVPNEQLQHEIAERKRSEKKPQQSNIRAEKPKRGIGPFNPQELKALSELAKRLT